MSTVNRNAVVKGPIAGGMKQWALPVSNSISPVNAGDLVWLDTATHLIKSIDSDAHAANIAGVALQPSVVNSNLDNGTIPAPSAIMVGADVIVSMKTTASEVYYTGQAVYIGADAQTITNVAATNQVGTVILPESYAAGASLTGATGVLVQIYIKNKAL